ncbi:MAG: ABC transporter ATP-binding protein [Chloroflexi bacterium]|nr:ABC transporter ATP-binding protein [Chloroflexota bacterium]
MAPVSAEPLPVVLEKVSKAFRVDGRVVMALRDVSLEARREEFVTLIGPSGCGKSTLLNLICGLLKPDAGEIFLYGDPKAQRLGRVGYMPQRDLLLPWRSVMDNILLGPEVSGRDLTAARKEARQLLPLFGLDGFENHYPATLSGGMRQRAALMRTFLCKQEIVLLDEPFGALDALTRRIMRRWLLDVWAQFRQTLIFVTHDVDEAIFLSDRVYVMSPRPGTILREVTIPLPRPRSERMVSQADFAALRQDLLQALGVIP